MAREVKIHAVVKVNDLENYAKLLPALYETTKKEPGCISYSCNQETSGDNKGEVIFFKKNCLCKDYYSCWTHTKK